METLFHRKVDVCCIEETLYGGNRRTIQQGHQVQGLLVCKCQRLCYGRPKPDVQGERILEYALAVDLLLGNTCFKKLYSHLITYKSGNIATQIDFILFCRTMHRLVTDVKVITGEEVALQHQLLVCDMRIDVPPKSKRKFTPRLKV